MQVERAETVGQREKLAASDKMGWLPAGSVDAAHWWDLSAMSK